MPHRPSRAPFVWNRSVICERERERERQSDLTCTCAAHIDKVGSTPVRQRNEEVDSSDTRLTVHVTVCFRSPAAAAESLSVRQSDELRVCQLQLVALALWSGSAGELCKP